jgi:signal transduction histidine kinase
VRRVLAGAPPLELEQAHALATADGSMEIALTCRPLLDARKRVSGAIIVFRDPAEMPLSPAEMVGSNRMETLGRLACGIAHDFNNLLTTVTGGISLALDKRDFGPLETAQKACATAKNLARQLLTIARGENAGRRVQSLNDVARETARMAGAGSKTTIEFELFQDLHPVAIDSAQFVQVFTNLMLNAMQAMPEGGRIWIRTLNMPLGQINSVSLPAGDYVRVDVQDNGPGIAPENLARIFEPFFTTKSEGTGLGLAMVRSIVAQHEGAIEASSTVGSGTTFTIYLPRALQEPAK